LFLNILQNSLDCKVLSSRLMENEQHILTRNIRKKSDDIYDDIGDFITYFHEDTNLKNRNGYVTSNRNNLEQKSCTMEKEISLSQSILATSSATNNQFLQTLVPNSVSSMYEFDKAATSCKLKGNMTSPLYIKVDKNSTSCQCNTNETETLYDLALQPSSKKRKKHIQLTGYEESYINIFESLEVFHVLSPGHDFLGLNCLSSFRNLKKLSLSNINQDFTNFDHVLHQFYTYNCLEELQLKDHFNISDLKSLTRFCRPTCVSHHKARKSLKSLSLIRCTFSSYNEVDDWLKFVPCDFKTACGTLCVYQGLHTLVVKHPQVIATSVDSLHDNTINHDQSCSNGVVTTLTQDLECCIDVASTQKEPMTLKKSASLNDTRKTLSELTATLKKVRTTSLKEISTTSFKEERTTSLKEACFEGFHTAWYLNSLFYHSTVGIDLTSFSLTGNSEVHWNNFGYIESLLKQNTLRHLYLNEIGYQ